MLRCADSKSAETESCGGSSLPSGTCIFNKSRIGLLFDETSRIEADRVMPCGEPRRELICERSCGSLASANTTTRAPDATFQVAGSGQCITECYEYGLSRSGPIGSFPSCLSIPAQAIFPVKKIYTPKLVHCMTAAITEAWILPDLKETR